MYELFRRSLVVCFLLFFFIFTSIFFAMQIILNSSIYRWVLITGSKKTFIDSLKEIRNVSFSFCLHVMVFGNMRL